MLSMYRENNMNPQFSHLERDTVSYYQQLSHEFSFSSVEVVNSASETFLPSERPIYKLPRVIIESNNSLCADFDEATASDFNCDQSFNNGALPGFDSFRLLCQPNTKPSSPKGDCSLLDLWPSIPHRSISLPSNQPHHFWDYPLDYPKTCASLMNVQVNKDIVNHVYLIEELSGDGQNDGEGQINDESNDDNEYEMDVDESSDVEETEVDDRSDPEPEKHWSLNNKSRAGKLVKKSSSPSKLTIPNRTYTGARTYKCHWERCSKEFVNRFTMKRHYRTHTGERPFKCALESCNKTFIQKHHMVKHYKIHIGERVFKCPWNNCTKEFIYRHHMQSHYRTHTGERPFKCLWNGCTMKFGQKHHMQTHYRIHTGERPFKCLWNDCTMEFIQKQHMHRHYKIHTGEKKFKCSWDSCTMKFIQKYDMQNHYKTHRRLP